MLLTSGQVSFAITSIIVFLFTAALFLSGYVLQQQTVRDLRAAIKPQLVRLPSGPDFFPPPRFREDGYLVDAVVVETDNERSHGGENGKKDVDEDDMIGATRWQKAARRKKRDEAKKQRAASGTQGGNSKSSEKILSASERRRQIKEQILADGNGESFKGYRRRMW